MILIKKLTTSIIDFESLDFFIKSQISSMPKDFFFPPNASIIEKSLSEETGISCGAFDHDKLIGIRLTYLPGLDCENHGYDLSFTNEELKQVAQFHGTIVRDDKRYKGIGNKLVKKNCSDIFERGFSRILSTVHPDNKVSIKMLLRNGFVERKRTTKYNNLPRIIFEKIKPNKHENILF